MITSQKMKFFNKDFFSKCDQIRSFLQIWSHLLKKSLTENFIFCAVNLWYFVLRYELPYKNYVRINLGTCVRFSLGNYVIKPCKWEQKDT